MPTNLNVRDVMQSNVHSVSEDLPLPELEQRFVDQGVRGFPVVKHGELIGVISRSDVVQQLVTERRIAETTSDFFWDGGEFREQPAETIDQVAARVGQRIESLLVKDVMNRNVVTVLADDSLETAAQKLLSHHIHRAPVLDNGRLVGIFSALDLTRLFADKRVHAE